MIKKTTIFIFLVNIYLNSFSSKLKHKGQCIKNFKNILKGYIKKGRPSGNNTKKDFFLKKNIEQEITLYLNSKNKFLKINKL